MKAVTKVVLVFAAVAGVISGCATKSEFKDLKERMDALESNKIQSIEGQISSINTSIGLLEQMDGDIKALQTEDESLQKRVAELKYYADSTLADTKDWVKATLVTLDEYSKTADVIAGIQAHLDTLGSSITKDYQKAIAKSINESVESMKLWVNEQMTGNYDIATMNAKLDSLKSALEKQTSEQGSDLKELIGQNTKDIEALESDLKKAAEDITEAYKKAIEEAITKYNGTITETIQNEIDGVNKTIDALDERVSGLETKVANLEKRMDEVEKALKNLASITYIPKYSDGKERVGSLTQDLTLRFDVYPADCAEAIAAAYGKAAQDPSLTSPVSARAVYTIMTKAYAGELVDLGIKGVKADNGILTVTVSPEKLDNDFLLGNLEAAVVLKVNTGYSNIQSDYIPLIYSMPYITFCATSTQGFKMELASDSDAASKFSDCFEYSTDGGENWTKVPASMGYVSMEGGSKLLLRGKSRYGTGILNEWGYVHPYKSCYIKFSDANVPVACYGDIRTLVDWENYSTVSTADARFPYLFSESKVLSSAPDLPATELASRCYCHMFEDNALLKVAPALPAMKLTAQCYESMFLDCASLTVAPELPATELAENCYYDMFNGTAITKAPSLPATTLAEYCYSKMFRDTPITSAPELPVKVLARSCYSEMFRGCTQLKAAPELPATTLAISCYYGMFNGCTSITEAPELPATKIEYDCYCSMFEGCTSITEAPTLPAVIAEESCYANMFSGCTSLKTAPELPATTIGYACYSGMFKNCTSLTAAPVLPAKGMRTFCYSEMFSGCSNIDEVTVKTEATLQAVQDSSAFDGWLHKVAAAGTIHKRSTLELPTASTSGIPSGWSAVDDVTD